MKLHRTADKNKLHISCKKRLRNKGMTMVEVMIGFVVLMILLEGLVGTIFFANKMYMRSVDLKKLQDQVSEQIYKKDAKNSGSPVKSSLDVTVLNPGAAAGEMEEETPLLSDGTAVTLDVKLYQLESDVMLGTFSTPEEGMNIKLFLFDNE